MILVVGAVIVLWIISCRLVILVWWYCTVHATIFSGCMCNLCVWKGLYLFLYIINFELASIVGHLSSCVATPGNSVTCDGWGGAWASQYRRWLCLRCKGYHPLSCLTLPFKKKMYSKQRLWTKKINLSWPPLLFFQIWLKLPPPPGKKIIKSALTPHPQAWLSPFVKKSNPDRLLH